MNEYAKRRQIIRILKEKRPKNRRELTRLGIETRQIGAGCFRRVFEVVGYPLVLKFGGDDAAPYGAPHTLREALAYERIKRVNKWRPFRRYLPKIYYVDPKGVWLLMKKYDTRRPRDAKYGEAFNVLDSLAKDLGGRGDIHNLNARIENGRIRIIDLGLVLKRVLDIKTIIGKDHHV